MAELMVSPGAGEAVAVSGVTPQLPWSGISRQASTRRRISFTAPDTSYCCSSVESPSALVKDKLLLALCPPLCFLGFGIGGDEFSGPAPFDDDLGGLSVWTQLPMPRRILIRRVKDRLFKEPILHQSDPLPTWGRFSKAFFYTQHSTL